MHEHHINNHNHRETDHHHNEHDNSSEQFNTSPGGDQDSNAFKDIQNRASERNKYSTLDEADMSAFYDKMWLQRKEATKAIIALTEEMISRMVKQHLPEAAEIVLYEDHSHDEPHAHVKHIVDHSGAILIEGVSDEWHDLPWSNETDELVWDLYHLDRTGFIREQNGKYRRITIL